MMLLYCEMHVLLYRVNVHVFADN